ncbi:MAG: SUMF1/EgtB/PvdO family nonheme iron enzyme, partial [Planctomycetota bacterium]
FMMNDRDWVASVLPVRHFQLGITQVTQGQWRQVMGTEPWKGRESVESGRDYPTSYVSMIDATEFCQKLMLLDWKNGKLKADEEYRIPTEAEWEYSCRAGTETAFSFGENESKLGQYGWFAGNTLGEKYPHKVGLKKPNPWGLHDMHGSVLEWCSDSYHTLAVGEDSTDHGNDSYSVARGGCWRFYSIGCRSAARSLISPSDFGCDLGFRVARSSLWTRLT